MDMQPAEWWLLSPFGLGNENIYDLPKGTTAMASKFEPETFWSSAHRGCIQLNNWHTKFNWNFGMKYIFPITFVWEILDTGTNG